MRALPRRRSAIVALATAGLALGALAAPTTASAAEPEGCSYGTGGPYADTLCWIDLASYDDALARGAGQPFTITLPGDYTVDFVLTTEGPRAIADVPFPTWDGAPVGNQIYLGTTGSPALYQVPGNDQAYTLITLEDIVVEDSEGNEVQGWQIVGIDAEGTANSESITFSADEPVSPLASYDAVNGCQVNVDQIDANTVRCTGGAIPGAYGTLLVSSTQPTEFSQRMEVNAPFAAQAVAFAFQSAKVELDAVVASRASASDVFDIAVTSPESLVIGAASTGAATSATTGELTVLPRVTSGSAYTLSVSGANQGSYSFDWACTVNGVADPALSATGVTSIQVNPAAGELVTCSVTASARLAATGTDIAPIVAAGLALLVLGGGIVVVRRRVIAG